MRNYLHFSTNLIDAVYLNKQQTIWSISNSKLLSLLWKSTLAERKSNLEANVIYKAPLNSILYNIYIITGLIFVKTRLKATLGGY